MDVHTLAVQMGTSILMIERHYSHLTPRLKKEMLTGKRYETPIRTIPLTSPMVLLSQMKIYSAQLMMRRLKKSFPTNQKQPLWPRPAQNAV